MERFGVVVKPERFEYHRSVPKDGTMKKWYEKMELVWDTANSPFVNHKGKDVNSDGSLINGTSEAFYKGKICLYSI